MQLSKYIREGKTLWKLEVDGYFVTLTSHQLNNHSAFNEAVRRQTLIDERQQWSRVSLRGSDENR